MKVHKLYELRLEQAEQQKAQLEAQVQECRSRLHEALLANKIGQAEQLQTVLENLQRKLKLAEAKVAAVKGTEPKALEETKQAKKDLEKALPILENLSNKLPDEWEAIKEQLENLATTLDEFTTGYQVLMDKHFEVSFLADLIDEDVTIPKLFQFDTSPLPEAAHRLKMAAQSTSFPNAQIRWQRKIAELNNVRNKEEKKKRRKEANYKQQPDVFGAARL
jgi:hypothetical protein